MGEDIIFLLFKSSENLGQKRRSSRREAYIRTSSLENGGKKSPIKIEIRKDFYLKSSDL